MAQVAPKVTISKFSSGDPIQWSIFRQNFENWVGLFDNNVDAAVKKRYLFTFLEGDAAIKAQDLYAYVGDATKTVKNCLDDLGQLYAPAASGELAVSLFHSAKQEAHESIERWSTRCRVLYGRAFPQDDARTSPHLIHAFISGLFHPEYRPAILLKRPTTYKDALTHAQEVVAALAINDPQVGYWCRWGQSGSDPGSSCSFGLSSKRFKLSCTIIKLPSISTKYQPCKAGRVFDRFPLLLSRELALLPLPRLQLVVGSAMTPPTSNLVVRGFRTPPSISIVVKPYGVVALGDGSHEDEVLLPRLPTPLINQTSLEPLLQAVVVTRLVGFLLTKYQPKQTTSLVKFPWTTMSFGKTFLENKHA